jgi:hypothetical protein
MREIVPEHKAQLVTITCDRCQATYHPKERFADEMEALEFLSHEAMVRKPVYRRRCSLVVGSLSKMHTGFTRPIHSQNRTDLIIETAAD